MAQRIKALEEAVMQLRDQVAKLQNAQPAPEVSDAPRKPGRPRKIEVLNESV